MRLFYQSSFFTSAILLSSFHPFFEYFHFYEMFISLKYQKLMILF
jgi:hypothetical protein